MNCKTLFSGPLTLANFRKMSNACRAALVSFLFDNREHLDIPVGFFTCFLNPPCRYVNPVDIYSVCKSCNIESANIVRQYHSVYRWAIRVNMSYFSKF